MREGDRGREITREERQKQKEKGKEVEERKRKEQEREKIGGIKGERVKGHGLDRRKE